MRAIRRPSRELSSRQFRSSPIDRDPNGTEARAVHVPNARASKSVSSSGPVDATNLTHSVTVSGGAIPIRLGGSVLSKGRSSVACSRQSVSPIQRANRSGPHAQNGSRARDFGQSIAGTTPDPLQDP